MKFIAIIPARYASTRFPAKPLAVLGGKPVIRRVYEQVAGVLDDAVVATDDERIYDAVVAFGGKAEMTSADHQSGDGSLLGSLPQAGKALRRGRQRAGRRAFHPGVAARSREALLRRSRDGHRHARETLCRSGRPGRAGKPQFAEGGARCAVAGHLFFAFGHPLPARRRTLAVACAPYVLQAPRPLCLSARRCCVPSRRCRSPRSKRPSRSRRRPLA